MKEEEGESQQSAEIPLPLVPDLPKWEQTTSHSWCPGCEPPQPLCLPYHDELYALKPQATTLSFFSLCFLSVMATGMRNGTSVPWDAGTVDLT